MRECEVCWATEKETIIYPYHGADYCADDLERAKEEGWEACDECGAIHDEEDEAMTIKEVGEPIYIGRRGGKANV